MKFPKSAAAALCAAIIMIPGVASADQYLGSYVARLSWNDHHASDGYTLDNAAQVVRQDRANVHKFGKIDGEDQGDPWFGSASARARFQAQLERRSAMSSATRQTIMNGTPLIEVQVYSNSVEVQIIGR